jgi:hypothetical protein
VKDENIYVFICAKSSYRDRTFEYSGAYSIGKNVNFDDIRDRLTKDMNECFEEYYFDEINPFPRAVITSMNEISKELYERLCQ